MHDSKEKNGKILIVDDEPKNIQLLGNTLQEKGYAVEFATNGREALEWACSSPFDLFLLDVMMPEMDGFELCRRLKSLPEIKDVPVIFLTAKVESGNIVKGFELGAVDYITKPFNAAELLARTATHIELKFSRDVLKEMALTDGLTKLYNHSCLHDRLDEEISRARRYGRPLSLIMFDLDHFKQINDTYGHKTGDAVLIRVAEDICRMIRKEDVAGRYGGEEFVIILPNTDAENACKVAEKIRINMETRQWDPPELRVTVSGGVCSLNGEDANRLIGKADGLLYEAKKNGRNRIMAG